MALTTFKVIGRGGEQIKKLQQESNCKIRIASGIFISCNLLFLY